MTYDVVCGDEVVLGNVSRKDAEAEVRWLSMCGVWYAHLRCHRIPKTRAYVSCC